MSTNDASTATTPQLPFRSFLGYGAGDMANNLAFSLVTTFLTLYYTDVALISPAAVGLLFLVMRLIDAFTDVIAGSLIDRTHTRFGKFRPWILVFCVPLVAMAVLTFSVPEALRGTFGAVVWAWVTYFLLGSVFYTLVNIPYGSLAAAMTQRPEERARLATFRTAGSALMQVIVALAISPAIQQFRGDPDGLQGALTQTIIVLGIVTILLYLVLVFTAREQVERDVPKVRLQDAVGTLRKNRALGTLAVAAVVYLVGLFTIAGMTIFYVRDVLGDATFTPVALALTFSPILVIGWFLPRLVGALGKKRLYAISAVVGAVGAAVLLLAPPGAYVLAVIGFLLLGASSGVCNTVMWNLEADSIEYGELQTGIRTEGTTYAVFSFMRKLGQAIGGAAGVWIIGLLGYVGGAESQSESAVWGIRIAVGAVPVVLFLASALLIRAFPFDERTHTEALQTIRERRTGVQPTMLHPLDEDTEL
ncbi:glycoside-pentoside-hexuronide (GPH):cation symporter [Agrococcus beijingensis]|uniref:glycoside-pentoside-hexuronide (GPH):cation symporter n=1 Tax=Agrococcus beijingensis TaxID=3068634 RepID=UPI002740777F|nr:glycoside-pentoside-hexuronide (GPH):cation symporter [Agrococcus sp. REN33]